MIYKRQQELISLIRKLKDRKLSNFQFMKELCDKTKIAKPNVFKMLKRLRELGIIERQIPFRINEEKLKELRKK